MRSLQSRKRIPRRWIADNITGKQAKSHSKNDSSGNRFTPASGNNPSDEGLRRTAEDREAGRAKADATGDGVETVTDREVSTWDRAKLPAGKTRCRPGPTLYRGEAAKRRWWEEATDEVDGTANSWMSMSKCRCRTDWRTWASEDKVQERLSSAERPPVTTRQERENEHLTSAAIRRHPAEEGYRN